MSRVVVFFLLWTDKKKAVKCKAFIWCAVYFFSSSLIYAFDWNDSAMQRVERSFWVNDRWECFQQQNNIYIPMHELQREKKLIHNENEKN